MARRSQPYRLSWPFTAAQLEQTDEMFQMLFDDTDNGSLEISMEQITSGVLTVPFGGTGLDEYVIGDILQASATDELSTLAAVATGNALISGGVGVVSSWGKIGLTTHVSGILPVPNGGTGFASYTIGDLLYADTTVTLAKLADVAAGAYLRAGGVATAPVWSSVTLPNAAAVGDIWYASTTAAMTALADVSAGSYLRSGGVNTAPLWSTVKIPNTATTGDLWQGTASNTISALASVAAGSYLRSGGVTTASVWSTLKLPNASTQGDLFYANASNVMIVLAKNASATRYLSNTGASNDPAWAQVELTNGVTGILPVANGGTGTSTAFTLGSVVFAGVAGVYSEKNAEFFWDNTNNRLGIGTTTPGAGGFGGDNARVDVKVAGSGATLIGYRVMNTSNTAGSQAVFDFRVAGSSAGDPFVSFGVEAVTNWAFGCDNSDSDTVKLSTGGGPSGNGEFAFAPNALFVLLPGTTTPTPSGGTAGIIFTDGTPLSGMAANTAGIYANDVAGTVEMFMIDEGGAATQQTPHNFTLFTPDDNEPYPWSYYSLNEYLGIEIGVDLARLTRLVEQITGETLIHIRQIPVTQDWDTNQRFHIDRIKAAWAEWDSMPTHPPEHLPPRVPVVRDPPPWLETRLERAGRFNRTTHQALVQEVAAFNARRGTAPNRVV